ncbi:MAG: ATP phosphoribosyltransferase regulatory subunit [Oscillospiraceae bacterium]|jgi:ATP phosphoribosyltransferase regulatory subunit|nr:ATP phosphoribosyltransferase regulatory subunit [Oscillospiraceae bacterium]
MPTTPLRPDERLSLALRGLYEQYGYQKFTMSRFEPYDFYARHRDFLAAEQMITFTGLDGQLLALRPDVTLSIVKKVDAGDTRLYYAESVYRPSPREGVFRESNQVGVEHIGPITPYDSLEMVLLALQSLRMIAPEVALDLSHTGYIAGLLNPLPIDEGARRALRRCLEAKNPHELAAIAKGRVSDEDLARLLGVARFGGTLDEARALAKGNEMHHALDKLSALLASLDALGESGAVRLDFSIAGDAQYYSGLMLRGYVSSIPDVALSGGRYDPLLRRMGKPGLSGLGFAVYFDALAQFLSPAVDNHADTAIVYAPDADPAAVARAVRACVDRGERVFAGMNPPPDIHYARLEEVR